MPTASAFLPTSTILGLRRSARSRPSGPKLSSSRQGMRPASLLNAARGPGSSMTAWTPRCGAPWPRSQCPSAGSSPSGRSEASGLSWFTWSLSSTAPGHGPWVCNLGTVLAPPASRRHWFRGPSSRCGTSPCLSPRLAPTTWPTGGLIWGWWSRRPAFFLPRRQGLGHQQRSTPFATAPGRGHSAVPATGRAQSLSLVALRASGPPCGIPTSCP